MKRSLLFAIVLFPLFVIAQDSRLVWHDEFSGPVVDTAYWNFEDNARGGGNAELQYYTPRNISVERHPVTGDTCLVLMARRENYRNRPATSARLNTQDKVTVKYGRVEARIAFPHTADGLWPAFWMLGNNLATNLGDNDDVDKQVAELAKQGRVVWPKCGEIDICEHVGYDQAVIHSTIHTGAYNHMKNVNTPLDFYCEFC